MRRPRTAQFERPIMPFPYTNADPDFKVAKNRLTPRFALRSPSRLQRFRFAPPLQALFSRHGSPAGFLGGYEPLMRFGYVMRAVFMRSCRVDLKNSVEQRARGFRRFASHP